MEKQIENNFDGFSFSTSWLIFKNLFVEPRAKRLSHEGGGADDRSNIEVKQEFFMDFTLEMNW